MLLFFPSKSYDLSSFYKNVAFYYYNFVPRKKISVFYMYAGVRTLHRSLELLSLPVVITLLVQENARENVVS